MIAVFCVGDASDGLVVWVAGLREGGEKGEG